MRSASWRAASESALANRSITVEKHNTPLAEATTPSLEALKAYSMGVKVVASRGEAAALPFFKQASEIDPNFALAYVRLGLMYGTLGESEFGMRVRPGRMNCETGPATKKGSL